MAILQILQKATKVQVQKPTKVVYNYTVKKVTYSNEELVAKLQVHYNNVVYNYKSNLFAFRDRYSKTKSFLHKEEVINKLYRMQLKPVHTSAYNKGKEFYEGIPTPNKSIIVTEREDIRNWKEFSYWFKCRFNNNYRYRLCNIHKSTVCTDWRYEILDTKTNVKRLYTRDELQSAMRI